MRALALYVAILGCGKVESIPDATGALDITPDEPRAFVRQGADTELVATVVRDSTVGAVTVTVEGLPAGVTAAPVELAPGMNAARITVAASTAAAHGLHLVTLRASAGALSASTDPLSLVVAGAPGSLDTSFAGDGTFVPTLNNMPLASRGLIITPAGIVVTGFVVTNPFQAITVRVRDDGTLDDTFGTGGFVSTGAGPGAEGIAIAADGDALIIAGIAGGASSSDLDFGIIRYTANGALDTAFGASGVATFDPGVGFGELHTAIVAPDRNIFVGGTLFGASTSSRGLRYSPTGTRDVGYSINEPDVVLEASLLDGDGKLVMAGAKRGDFWVARYLATGARDTSFGTGGEVGTDLGGSSTGFGLVALPGEKLLVAGTTTDAASGRTHLSLAQYNANGSLDATFGNGGTRVSMTQFETRSPSALALAPDGARYFIGSIAGVPAIVRILSDGSLDQTFGIGGSTTIDFGVPGSSLGLFGIGFDGEGRIVVAADVGANAAKRMAIARLWH